MTHPYRSTLEMDIIYMPRSFPMRFLTVSNLSGSCVGDDSNCLLFELDIAITKKRVAVYEGTNVSYFLSYCVQSNNFILFNSHVLTLRMTF